ncbi:putative uncharacterized protein DDB_G0277255 [Condylostylus longicornis]|uniref:putative uncharacterized protein DDB_G0277255 n=1 Tax=Condylostylus longicornis TaxID=2530218 RepID=UPI00244DC6EA|nr:putative uncharacterized protein DDB_G0277255 [Condylostylus longicornis]XP_055387031.1 putative uncharacterized protein DDB_G0277255 [Condylostylus longicornis]XP_055387032.1 putative uncharacterized protein DDB_G0277255 [Condylostylus longicornis]XP_055387033.1 putative uncharacterized protein DDB_G0277255 [Condylostylus longicornis]XP_055387034.1 putative uncharacterized protein DDB_G0277255 [Condylostylus longicornis]
MENQIKMDLKNKTCSIVNVNEVNNSETDIIANENQENSQQQKQQQQENQFVHYETNQELPPLQSIDKNLFIDNSIMLNDDLNANNNQINRDYLEFTKSSLNNQKLQSECILQQQTDSDNIEDKINLIPLSSSIDLNKSIKSSASTSSSSSSSVLILNTENNQLIEQVQNYNNDKPTTSVIEITSTTPAIIPVTIEDKTTNNAIIEITKESESLKQQQQQQNYNNDNSINALRNENVNKMYEMKEKTEENNKKINCDNIKNFELQQQQQSPEQHNNELLPTTTATIAMEAAKAAATAAEKLENLISAVCSNNENNESKSECYNSNKQVLSDNDDQGIDIDVITISSTDENVMDNLKDVEFEKFQEELLKNFNKKISQQKQKEQLEKELNESLEKREQQLLTENSLKNSLNLQRTHSKTESVLEYLNSVEPTVTEIQEKLIEFDGSNTAQSSDNGSSLCSTNVLNDSESEEDDQLKPLMQDNHTIVVNHEFFVYNNSNDKYQQNPSYNDILLNKRLISNNNNSNTCSSTDSDLSTQFDHRDLTTMSQNSLEDYNDSGLDTLSQPFINKSSTKEIHLKQFEPIPPAPATTPVTGVPIMANNVPYNPMQQESEENEIREIDTLSPIEIPDDKLCEDIVEQVEYYFSNDSILKDAFLLKHVRRNKEGFVSLKLVSSFKRVRQFTKDWRVVGIAIERKSKKIELNSLGTKIRRLDPLPNFDETMPSRTIVVCDLPFEKLSIDKITDIFSKCGEIALVRILKPGMQIPVDVRQFMNKYPEMQQKECALVEFIDSASARFAKTMQGNYKIFEMVAPKKKTGKKSITTITKFIENYKYPDANYERTRGGIENGHHYHQSYNSSHGQNINYNSNNQQGHNNHYNLNHNQILQSNNNSNFENEYRPKLRSNYDVRNSQQQPQQNQESHLQNHIYQPPYIPQRRFSVNDQENNREHIQNMNNMNNQINTSNFVGNNNNNNLHFSHYSPRRLSNCSVNELQSRKYSSCSEGYSSCSDYSRRASLTSSSQDSSSRKTSASCSDYCPCSRRTSQCSDIYRKISQQSDIVSSSPNRRFSNGSFHGFERQYSNTNDPILLSNSHNNNMNSNNTMRRVSFDSNYDRKISSSSINSNNNNNNINNYNNTLNNNNNNNINNQQQQQQQNGQYICDNHYRKYSNGFDPNRKLSYTDQYFNGRRISTDSGYDRKLSFSSDISSTSTSPRSRANSFILPSQHKTAAEILVRTPIGPDGSKGFASRARKVGQIQSVN